MLPRADQFTHSGGPEKAGLGPQGDAEGAESCRPGRESQVWEWAGAPGGSGGRWRERDMAGGECQGSRRQEEVAQA